MDGITLFGLNKRGKKSPSAKKVFLETIGELDVPEYEYDNELWLLTCYINFNTVSDLIDKVRNKKNISSVYLMFNVAEAYKTGTSEVSKILKNISNLCESNSIDFQWRAISTNDSSIMHAKGYAFFQRKQETNEVTDGFHLVTSSNFTKSGFQTASNIELGYFSKKLEDLKKFERIYDYLWNNNSVELTSEFSDIEETLFHFALLSYGVFLHKWGGNINNLTGIKYDFTDDARKQLTGQPVNPLLISLNARAERASFTVPYLDFSNLPEKVFPIDFTKTYCVQTYLGWWCPKPVWNMVNKYISKDLDNFIKEFNKSTSKDNIDSAKKQIKLESKELNKQGLIKGEINLDGWERRIRNLKEDKERLRRLHIGYEEFEMPYNCSDKYNIKRLYESFESTLDSVQKPVNEGLFLVKKRSIDAMESLKLSEYELSKEEKRTLKNKFI